MEQVDKASDEYRYWTRGLEPGTADAENKQLGFRTCQYVNAASVDELVLDEVPGYLWYEDALLAEQLRLRDEVV